VKSGEEAEGERQQRLDDSCALHVRSERCRRLGGGAPALLAVFAYRLINLWLPMIPALAGLPTLRRLERTRPRHRAQPQARRAA
jgi:hypothetical protein